MQVLNMNSNSTAWYKEYKSKLDHRINWPIIKFQTWLGQAPLCNVQEMLCFGSKSMIEINLWSKPFINVLRISLTSPLQPTPLKSKLVCFLFLFTCPSFFIIIPWLLLLCPLKTKNYTDFLFYTTPENRNLIYPEGLLLLLLLSFLISKRTSGLF